MKTVKIAIMGFGNIGVGTYQGLEINHDAIAEKTGIDLQIKRILEIQQDRPRPVTPAAGVYTTDIADILEDPEIAVVIELLGGLEPATSFMIDAMKAGKHVVTANKAAIAANYEKLMDAAKANNVLFRFEASVGGGIPVLTAIQNALLANQFEEVTGILNGTTNFILTQMTEGGRAYDDVLKEAQAKGFAEADPTADVEGHDVANKLSILISLCFGKRVKVEDIPTVGITGVTAEEIEEAKKAGEVIKLLASAKLKDGKVECSVGPQRIAKSHPLAGVSNEFNALYIKGNIVGETMFYGKGAGPLPTGSAILGDVIDIARQLQGGLR